MEERSHSPTPVDAALSTGGKPEVDGDGDRSFIWTGPGWAPYQIRYWLDQGRDWEGVREWYRLLVMGQVSLAELGLVRPEDCMTVQAGEQQGQVVPGSGARAEAVVPCQELAKGKPDSCAAKDGQLAEAASAVKAAAAQQYTELAQEAEAVLEHGPGIVVEEEAGLDQEPSAKHRTQQGVVQVAPEAAACQDAVEVGPAVSQPPHDMLLEDAKNEPERHAAASEDRRLELEAAGKRPGAAPAGKVKRKRMSKGKVKSYCKMIFSYFGPAFGGWSVQSDPSIRAIEGVVNAAVHRAAPTATNISVAGRTDKAVSACAQVVSFSCWDPICKQQVLQAVDEEAPGQLRAWHLEVLPGLPFHATFRATWRRYIYLLPLERSADGLLDGPALCTRRPLQQGGGIHMKPEELQQLHAAGAIDPGRVDVLLQKLMGRPLDYHSYARDTPKGKNPICVLRVARAKEVLLHLPGIPGDDDLPPSTTVPSASKHAACHEGRQVPVKHADRPSSSADASMSCEPSASGPIPSESQHVRGGTHTTECATSPPSAPPCRTEDSAFSLSHLAGHPEPDAVALSDARPSCMGGTQMAVRRAVRALCVELVGDRFLRKMARVLVSTAIRESVAGAGRCHGADDALLRLCDEQSRIATAPPALPDGLCFCGAGYEGISAPW